MRKRIWKTAKYLALLLVVSSCGGSPESELVGTWYEIGTDERVQFFEDGTIAVYGSDTISGDYYILDEQTMRIEFGGLGALAGPLVVKYELAGDILSLRMPDGDVDRYSKDEEAARTGEGLVFDESDPVVAAAMRDAEIRGQVSEGLNISGGAKAAVTEFYMGQGRFPRDNQEAGLSDAADIQSKYVSAVTVKAGIISVKYGNNADDLISGKTLIVTPQGSKGSVMWDCSSRQIGNEHLPAACR